MYTPGDSFHCLADRLFGDVWRCPSVWLKHPSLVATAFVMASAEEPTPKKRKGFVFKPIQIPDRTVKTPMFHQLRHGPAPPLPAPPIVQAMFGSERAFMAIDIETHALVPNNVGGSWWRTGEFGVLTTASEVAISTLRVVQVGWAIGEVTANEPKVKARLVLPEGFEIEASATAKHSITHAEAVSHGVVLKSVLLELIEDLAETEKLGGRLCSHHLGFDGGVLSEEMRRAGLDQVAIDWARFVRKGLCTMNPDICQWIRQQTGQADRPRNIPMRLADAVQAMVADPKSLLAKQHDAGCDARAHWALACELWKRARSDANGA